MKFRNLSPLGELAIAGVGYVDYGDTFDVTGEQLPGLVYQATHPQNPAGIYEAVDEEAKQAVADARGDTPKKARKAATTTMQEG